MSRYPEYDLEPLKAQLHTTHWEVVLPVFAPVRLATQKQVERGAGLSHNTVTLALRRMVETQDTHGRPVLTVHPRRIAHLAGESTPSNVYLLGPAGAALLRDQGLLDDTRPSEQADDEAIAQSLCMLELVLQSRLASQVDLHAERVFRNGREDTIRADLAGQDQDGTWHLLEIEREADENNHPRRARRLKSLHEFFAGPAGPETISPELLFLFNVRTANLPATRSRWQAALADLRQAEPELHFTLHAAALADFRLQPAWLEAERYPVLEPVARPAASAAAPSDPLTSEATEPDFRGFFAQAWELYRLARGRGGFGQQHRRPVTALRELRTLLENETWQAARLQLVEGLSVLKPSTAPGIVTNLLTKLYWDVVLRHYGIDRAHIGASEFQFAAVERQATDAGGVGYGDYHVRLSLPVALYEELKLEFSDTPHREQLERAAEWLLGALYIYAHELGLRPAPWWKRLVTRQSARRREA